MPVRTRAEGGQVELLLGSCLFSTTRNAHVTNYPDDGAQTGVTYSTSSDEITSVCDKTPSAGTGDSQRFHTDRGHRTRSQRQHPVPQWSALAP